MFQSIRCQFLQTTTAMVSLIACSAAQADTYNVSSDWSDSANQNGVWTYREGNNALPHVNSWQSTLGGWNTAQPAWAESENGNNRLPVWMKSNGSENFAHDWLAGDIILHSTDGFNGIGNGLANLLWTSPSGGVATITGGVWLGRDISRSVDWSLLKNGVAITGGSLSSGDAFNRASPFLFSAGSGGAAAVNNLAVSPGNTLELRLVTTSSNGGDFVGVDLSVSISDVLGDYNDDGTVSAADYTVWRDTLGSTTNLAANGNGNTVIDDGDYDVWRQNFGEPSGAASSSTAVVAVPEPTGAILLILAGALTVLLGQGASRR